MRSTPYKVPQTGCPGQAGECSTRMIAILKHQVNAGDSCERGTYEAPTESWHNATIHRAPTCHITRNDALCQSFSCCARHRPAVSDIPSQPMKYKRPSRVLASGRCDRAARHFIAGSSFIINLLGKTGPDISRKVATLRGTAGQSCLHGSLPLDSRSPCDLVVHWCAHSPPSDMRQHLTSLG